jgi:hypothetical protein
MLALLERSKWVRFNEGDLEIFRPNMQEKLKSSIFVIENLIKLSKKNWKKKLVV